MAAGTAMTAESQPIPDVMYAVINKRLLQPDITGALHRAQANRIHRSLRIKIPKVLKAACLASSIDW